MFRKNLVLVIVLVLLVSVSDIFSQDDMFGNSKISGNFQIDMQSYSKDTLIGSNEVDEQVLSNGFLWLTYSSNNFKAGLRYENYMNPILGIDKRYQGNGVAFKYAEFTSDLIDITAGNFYEQFGSGMIFRTYQEYALGFDNAMDGLRVKFRPADGIEIKGMIGKQRKFWTTGDGIIKGGDIGINLNTLFEETMPEDLDVTLGASVVSKFQKDLSSTYNLPQNVLLWSGRMSLFGTFFNLESEYGYKNADPSSANTWNFNPGNAFLLNSSFFGDGFGVSLNFHRNDNMDVRSEREELGNSLLMNYLPPLTKQHSYALATMYPYATQLNGEVGYQAEVTYTIPRKTLIGGRYGMTINANYSQVNSIVKTPTLMDTVRSQPLTYDAPFFEFGDDLFFREFNVEVTKKFSKEIKSVFTYLNQTYNRDVLEAEGSEHYGKVNTNILVADLTYKFSSKYALRTELQHMWSKQDSLTDGTDRQYGDWAAILMELTISPTWYFSITDQWNYGNENEDFQIHYITAAVTYVHDATRVSLGFGRQREGIICVGGVCRPVPASNGFFMSISSSF